MKTVLRDLTEPDLDFIVAWRNSPVVNEYLSDRLKSRPEVEAWYHKVKTVPENWLKLILVDGAAIGYATIESIDTKNRKCELAVVVGVPSLWGSGVGTEVAGQMLEYAFEKLKLHRVFACLCRGNDRSEKLLRSLNFRPEGIMRDALLIDGGYVDLLCFSLLEIEYKK